MAGRLNLRSAPCSGHIALLAFDSVLRKSISEILNINIDDIRWEQASLPVGGSGIRSANQLASSAFLASAAATAALVHQILPLRLSTVADPFVDSGS